MERKTIEIHLIQEFKELQHRATPINEKHVGTMVPAFKASAPHWPTEIPPVKAVYDKEVKRYIPYDGHHSLTAARRVGCTECDVTAVDGDYHMALRLSFPTNGEHEDALKRTTKDKQKYVTDCLAVYSELSDRAVAQMCLVSSSLVAGIRKTHLRENEHAPTTRVAKRGDQTYEIDTSNIGKSKSSKKLNVNPTTARALQRIAKQEASVPDVSGAVASESKAVAAGGLDVEEPGIVEPADEELTMEQTIAAKNAAIESFCRRLMQFVEAEMPDDPWLDELNRKDAALQKFKDGCTTLRSAKCHADCPKCNGDGCKKCLNTGRVTKAAYDQLV